MSRPAAPSADRLDRIAICLLDCDEESQLARLRGRGEPEELLHHHVAFQNWMPAHTSGRPPEEVAADALAWIRGARGP
jgi:hypothetical protein